MCTHTLAHTHKPSLTHLKKLKIFSVELCTLNENLKTHNSESVCYYCLFQSNLIQVIQ